MKGRPDNSVELGLEALRLYIRGYTGSEVAAVLGIEAGSVRNRMTRMLRQLGARTTAHAIVIAAIDGLLTREDLRLAYEDRRTTGEGEE